MSDHRLTDTIAAIATAPGCAGVGIVRISGDKARDCLLQLFTPYQKKQIMPRQLVLGSLSDLKGDYLDEGFAALFPAPHSYTKEDVVEFQCHGGPLVEKAVLMAILEAGVRLADPGEFTLRAFLNGRLDLSQAEAILDIIESKTKKGLALAEQQLNGALSDKIQWLEEILLELLAELSAAADFPDDIDLMSKEALLKRLAEAIVQADALLNGAGEGKIYREGISVVLAGAVNVGKSSILNALLEEERAIVTSVPGTTRDIIEEYFNLNGIPIRISDTAGLRQAADLVEEIGIDKSKAKLAAAQIILLVIDAERGLDEEAERLLIENHNRPLVIVINKTDIGSEAPVLEKIAKILPGKSTVSISAKTGKGLAELKTTLANEAIGSNRAEDSQIFITNTRHEEALIRARESLCAAQETIEQDLPVDLATVDLSAAWRALGEITGKTAGQDILDKIFSSFCLGK